MSLPSTQQFQLEYNKIPLGVIRAHRVPAVVNSPRIPELFRIDFRASDRNLRDSLSDAVVRYLNGSSRRMRQEFLGTEDRVTTNSAALIDHLNKGVLFLSEPRKDRPVRIRYIPRAAQAENPYVAPFYRFDSYLLQLGTVSSIA
jgi:hypothetical protein